MNAEDYDWEKAGLVVLNELRGVEIYSREMATIAAPYLKMIDCLEDKFRKKVMVLLGLVAHGAYASGFIEGAFVEGVRSETPLEAATYLDASEATAKYLKQTA